MSKKKSTSKKVPEEGQKFSQLLENISNSFINQVFGLLGKFGFPGIFSFVILFFIWSWASDNQKQELIDQFFLMKGGNQGIHMIVILIAFVLILLGQHAYFRRRIKALIRRVEKLKYRNAKLEGVVKGLQKRRVAC